MKKILIYLLTVSLLSAALTCTVFAGTAYRQVNISFKDKNIKMTGYLINSTTYVPFRDLYSKLQNADISWDAKTKTASAKYEGTKISAKVNDSYITVNNKVVKSTGKNLLINNRIYIPLRSASENMGLTVSWDQKTYTAELSYQENKNSEHSFVSENNQNPETKINENDLYWLSRIIYAEAVGQPLEGKIAVGNVVMNRARSKDYPDNVYDVIFDKKYGTQFSPTENGSIYNEPDNECIEAAKKVLEGYSLDDRIIYFVNHDLSESTWFYTRTFVFKIGDHSFYY